MPQLFPHVDEIFFNEKNIYDIRVSNITIIRKDRFKRSFLIFFQSYSASNCSRIRFRVGNRDTFNLLKSILSRSNLLCPFTLRLFNRGWSSYYFRYSQFLLYILFFLFTSYSLFSRIFKDRLQAVEKLFLPLFRNDTISLEWNEIDLKIRPARIIRKVGRATRCKIDAFVSPI